MISEDGNISHRTGISLETKHEQRNCRAIQHVQTIHAPVWLLIIVVVLSAGTAIAQGDPDESKAVEKSELLGGLRIEERRLDE